MTDTIQKNFSEALLSDKPAVDLGEATQLYSLLIGSWDVTAIDYPEDQEKMQTEGEWYFSWVLEGRAVQDVWIAPKRNQRAYVASKETNRYGSTMRFYDPAIKAWRLNWVNPVSGITNQLIAKKIGNDIIQEGKDAAGNLIKWSFVEMTSNSFHWKGETSYDQGKTFQIDAEFFAKRKS